MNDATNLFTKRGIHFMHKRVIDTDSQNTVSLTSPPPEPICDSSFTFIQGTNTEIKDEIEKELEARYPSESTHRVMSLGMMNEVHSMNKKHAERTRIKRKSEEYAASDEKFRHGFIVSAGRSGVQRSRQGEPSDILTKPMSVDEMWVKLRGIGGVVHARRKPKRRWWADYS